MPKMTQQKAICKALEARGYVPLQKRYSGCKAYSHPENQAKIYFVGSAGSLRVGMTRAGSITASNRTKAKLLDEGGYPVPYGATVGI